MCTMCISGAMSMSILGVSHNFAGPFSIRLLPATSVIPLPTECYADFGCLIVII